MASGDLPVLELAFPGPLRDSGVAAILAGEKTALTGLLRVLPISMVGDDYALAEGRGYADAADWRRAHEDFFTSDGVAEYLGATPVIGDDTLVVTERFRLVKPGSAP